MKHENMLEAIHVGLGSSLSGVTILNIDVESLIVPERLDKEKPTVRSVAPSIDLTSYRNSNIDLSHTTTMCQ